MADVDPLAWLDSILRQFSIDRNGAVLTSLTNAGAREGFNTFLLGSPGDDSGGGDLLVRPNFQLATNITCADQIGRHGLALGLFDLPLLQLAINRAFSFGAAASIDSRDPGLWLHGVQGPLVSC